jgi:hypothetical protein
LILCNYQAHGSFLPGSRIPTDFKSGGNWTRIRVPLMVRPVSIGAGFIDIE